MKLRATSLLLVLCCAGALFANEKSLTDDLRSRKAIDQWPLRDAFIREVTKRRGPMPAGVVFVPLAEVYSGDRAVLFACAGEAGSFRDPLTIPFKRVGSEWVADESLGDQTLLESKDARVVRRRAGLTLEQIPLFLTRLMRDEPGRFQAAERKGDFATCGAIVDEMMVGFSLGQADELIDLLRTGATSVKSVTMASKKVQPDGRLLAELVVTDDESSKHARFFLAPEGGGWVLDEPYWMKAQITMSSVRSVAVSAEAWATDHDEKYPPAKTMEELKAMVEPVYIKSLPMTDAWGTPLRYEVLGDGKGYRVVSAGEDRKFDPKSWKTRAENLRDHAEDMVLENGEQVRTWSVE